MGDAFCITYRLNIWTDGISFGIPLATDHRRMLSSFDYLFAIARQTASNHKNWWRFERAGVPFQRNRDMPPWIGRIGGEHAVFIIAAHTTFKSQGQGSDRDAAHARRAPAVRPRALPLGRPHRRLFVHFR